MPPGIYIEGLVHSPVFVVRGDAPLPGPGERTYFRVSPLWSLLLAPVLGTFFVLGFLALTIVGLLLIPVVGLRRALRRGAACWLAGALLLAGAAAADAQGISSQFCLNCHKNPLAITLGDGTRVSLQIGAEAFARSVHGRKLLCTACHTDIEGFPHPRRTFADRRDLSLAYSRACTTCHGGKFREFKEGVHWKLLEKGDRRAPLCADCHGAHSVTKGGMGRGKVSHACAACHAKVYGQFKESVHGSALLKNGSQVVPTCSTCHLSHTTEDPRKIEFRIDIPKLCADCHQNELLMAPYGISTNVVSTYLQDFHGVSVGLYGRQGSAPARLTAVCTDCHGVHDIRPVRDPQSHVIKANLLRTCQKCHPGAPANFPDAWLSHYVPSLRRAPLVYLVKLFYLVFLPGVVGCMIIHLGLDLFHEVRRRWPGRKRP